MIDPELMKRDHNDKQVDHIWPKAILQSKREVKKEYPLVTEDVYKLIKDNCHKLPNLQLLSIIDNRDKLNTPYSEWILKKYPEDDKRKLYFNENLIPENVSYDLGHFLEFIEARKKLLKENLKLAFPSDFNDIVNRYSLEDKLS